MIYSYLEAVRADQETAHHPRHNHINEIVNKIKSLRATDEPLALVFLCTHNSRRSQFAEFFARAWLNYFNVENMDAFSAGIEVTAVHDHVLTALDDAGFLVFRSLQAMDDQFPVVLPGSERHARMLYSKTIQDEHLPRQNFITIAVCSHAEENCPLMPGSLGRFSLPFEDPGAFDHQEDAGSHYNNTRDRIASTLYHLIEPLQGSE